MRKSHAWKRVGKAYSGTDHGFGAVINFRKRYQVIYLKINLIPFLDVPTGGGSPLAPMKKRTASGGKSTTVTDADAGVTVIVRRSRDVASLAT